MRKFKNGSIVVYTAGSIEYFTPIDEVSDIVGSVWDGQLINTERVVLLRLDQYIPKNKYLRFQPNIYKGQYALFYVLF